MPRVIKGDRPGGIATLGPTGALNVANFADQARKMLIEAKAKAQQALARAATEAEQIRSRAEQRGYAEGLRRGQADGQADGAEKAFAEAMKGFQQQTGELQTLLKSIVAELAGARERLLQEAQTDLLDLALAIAEKVTHVQAKADLSAAKAGLCKAIETVNCRGQIQVRVCPGQLGQLTEYGGEFLASMGMADGVSFVPDESLSPGDVVLTTRNGQVDAKIQTQIDNIAEALTGAEREAS